MKNITVFGSINIDITTYLNQRPLPGETVFAKDILLALGGKGANQCIAVSKLGKDAHMIGAIGNDSFGKDAQTYLEEAKVTCHLSKLQSHTTGLAVIDVAEDGSNDIRIAGGANSLMSPEIARQNENILSNTKILLLQHEVPLDASVEAARIAKAAGAIIIMDPAPAPDTQWSSAILSSFDLLTPNSHEVKSIIGWEPKNLDGCKTAAAEIATHTRLGAIVTAGSLGAAWCVNGEVGAMPAPIVKAVDTVAAGDCFNAGLAVGLADKLPIVDAIRFASHVAALATTKKGASDSAPTKDEVFQFIDNKLNIRTQDNLVTA